jgi:hypothetical protein
VPETNIPGVARLLYQMSATVAGQDLEISLFSEEKIDSLKY